MKERSHQARAVLVADMHTLEEMVLRLVKEAEEGEFGDFTNQKHASPKVELDRQLRAIAARATGFADAVRSGKYDG